MPGARRQDRREMAAPGALDLILIFGADEIDVAPGAFVVYIGSHGDRGAHRADVIAAGRGLYREVRPLCQHRRPGAARRPRRLPAGRRPRGLGDPARALRRARRSAALRLRSRNCARRCSSAIRIFSASTSSRRAIRRRSALLAQRGAIAHGAPFASAISDFYLTNPIARASARDGGMLGARQGPACSRRRNRSQIEMQDLISALVSFLVEHPALLAAIRASSCSSACCCRRPC